MEPSGIEPVTPKRAGRYVTQPAGYRAFIPAPLPPDPPVRIQDELQPLLSEADRALGRLEGSIQTLPHPDLFIFMYVRKEAVLSSQIEGTPSSLQDVLAAEARVLAPDRPKDVDEVVNYVAAMNHGLRLLTELPVSVRLIREIHRELLQGVRGSNLAPGELRTSQNWLGPRGCTLKEATYVPPPPHEVPKKLAELEQFLHMDTCLPLLIKIGLAHAQFETIHPFLDGNGRIGRLLITFLLCEQKALNKPVLYLSHFLKRYRQEYYERLQSVRDAGTWEEWLAFFLRGIVEVSGAGGRTRRDGSLSCARIIGWQSQTKLGRAAGNGHRALEYLYEHRIVSVGEIKELTGTTYPAANALVARMVEIGVLREITGQARHRRFCYQSYIDLFHENAPDLAP